MTENEQKQIFDTWINQYKRLIFKIVRAYAFTSMDQDDLFQDIILQVWRSIPGFRKECAPSTWIYRISLNIAIRWKRKAQRHPHTESLDHTQPLLQENTTQPDEQLLWLYRQIQQLNEIDRSITLLLLDELSYKEIADIMGISESNVGVRINRIKKRLVSKSKKYDDHGI